MKGEGSTADAVAISETNGCHETIRWFAPGQALQVLIAGQVVTVRFVARKGRRARIAIRAMPAIDVCAGVDT